MRASLNFSSLCQTNACNQETIMHSMFSFICLLKEPSACKLLLRLFLIIVAFSKLRPHQKMKFISSAFQDGILRGRRFFCFKPFYFFKGDCVCRMGGISLSSDDVCR